MNQLPENYLKTVVEEQNKYKKNGPFFYTVEQLKSKKEQVNTCYDDPIVMAFLKELCFRKLGLDAYPVQILAALRLYEGNIIEMGTGEGKTLVAIMASLLHALNHRKVHIITANDYLAERDFRFARSVFEELGLSCGYIGADSSLEDRVAAATLDVLYTTNREIAINYSNNRKATSKHTLVHNPFDVLIVDEADLLMIDEARREMLIGNDDTAEEEIFKVANEFALQINAEDYVSEPRTYAFYLTDTGVSKAKKYYSLDNYYSPENVLVRNAIKMAVSAHYSYKRDVDYIVKDGRIVLINLQTGRLMNTFKMYYGLQQALECKEGLEMTEVKSNFTKIPYQIIFNQYKTKSGMTGTAETEAKEFKEIYGLDVVIIPPNKPIQRVDLPDRIHATRAYRDDAVVRKIKELYSSGQPVLVGTTSVEHSELIATRLEVEGVPCQLLNAKNHAHEAAIIQFAGMPKSVTIATNMAGRGTDIKVPEESLALGGLFVLGTARYDSRRSDNQLRGRTGRQGDVGATQFFTSIEDDIIVNLNVKRIQQLMMVLAKTEKKEYIENQTIANLYNKAQISLEGKRFDERKQMLNRNKTLNAYYANYFDRKIYLLRSEFTPEEILGLLIESYKNDFTLNGNLLKGELANIDLEKKACRSDVSMESFYQIFNVHWSVFINRLETLSVNLFLDFASIGDKDLLHQKRVSKEYSLMVLNLKAALIGYLQE